MPAPVIPVVFPLILSSTDPVCAAESARLLADRIVELRQQMAKLLGLPLDIAITQALTIGAGLMGSRGLDCRFVDTTHLLMDADQVMTRSGSPGFVVHDNPLSISLDIGLGGPTVNGRDQAAAFAANAFVHCYWIYNGIALATLVSLAPPYPAPGPVLPTGYFLGAYAGAMLLDATALFVPANIRGRWTHFKAGRTVATPTSTYLVGTLQSISIASAVPPNAEAVRVELRVLKSGTSGANGTPAVTIFDGRESEVGSLSLQTGFIGSQFNVVQGGMVAQQHSQLLKITVPAIGSDVLEAGVKIMGFENPSLA
jgi:hypothetical protein